MKTTAALLCSAALLAAACSDNTPAKDPSSSDTSTTTTSTSSPATANNTASSSTMGAGAAPTDTSMSTGTTAMGNSGSSTGKSSTGGSSASSSAMNNSTTPTMGSAPMAAPADTTTGVAPDNTKKNERDRKGSTLTAADQGNSSAEVKITASIRKQVVGSSMSFNAKNAKIITTGTKVTLRGPVKTDDEKAQIETMAKATPGVTEVDNQLEVKK